MTKTEMFVVWTTNQVDGRVELHGPFASYEKAHDKALDIERQFATVDWYVTWFIATITRVEP